jgi:hypothetical protein
MMNWPFSDSALPTVVKPQFIQSKITLCWRTVLWIFGFSRGTATKQLGLSFDALQFPHEIANGTGASSENIEGGNGQIDKKWQTRHIPLPA